ncbi:MAG: transmembrane cytochrome oxidase associated protein [Psychromonas sp.]
MNNKKILSLFIISFIIPLALAFVVLKFDWLPARTVNNGDFLVPEVKLTAWSEIDPKPWSIGFIASNDCRDICLAHREEVKKLYLALGKKQIKVDLVLLGEQAEKLDGFKNYSLNNAGLSQDALYLIDHMGLVVFSYPIDVDPEINRLTNQGLIKDLKKLLKYARSS